MHYIITYSTYINIFYNKLFSSIHYFIECNTLLTVFARVA